MRIGLGMTLAATKAKRKNASGGRASNGNALLDQRHPERSLPLTCGDVQRTGPHRLVEFGQGERRIGRFSARSAGVTARSHQPHEHGAE